MKNLTVLIVGFTMAATTASVYSNDDPRTQKGSTEAKSTAKVLVTNLSQQEHVAIVEDAARAVQRYVRTDPEKRKGDEIAKEFWGKTITRLKPVRVMYDRVNVAIVLQDNDKTEQGLYVSLAISSYLPNQDNRFTTFEKLSKPEDKSFNTLYRYSIKKTDTKSKATKLR